MSNNSIIEHRANYYFIELREEYLHICQECSYKKNKSKASSHCKAFILAIMESWTNDKRGKGEDLAIYMTYPQWIEAMYGMFGRCVIIDSLEELIGESLLSREKHRMYGKDTYKYRLNCQELNRRVKLLPERDPKHTRPKVDASINRRDNSEDPSKSKRDTRLKVDEDPSKSRHNIESTKKPNIDNLSVDRATDVASPTDPLVSLSDQVLVNEITRREKEKLENASLIANPTIENVEPEVAPKNVEPVTTRNTSSKPRSPRVRVTEPLQKPLPKLDDPKMSEEARAVWNVWIDMPWNKAIPPKLTVTAAEHCETLSKVLITQDIMFKVRNFAAKNDRNGFYKGKSWELGHVVSEYSRWKSAEYQVKPETQEKPKVTVGNRAMQSFTFK
jgi:hypothetical protein